MKKAVDWIKGALAKKDIVLQFTHYFVKDGMIQAMDGRMLAAHPFPSHETFLVPGAEFEAILDRMPSDNPTLEVHEDKIRLKEARFRGDISTIPESEWPDLPMPKHWIEVQPDLLDAMAALMPFVSDNATKPFAGTIMIEGSRLYATNNVSIAMAEVESLLAGDEQTLLPRWAVEFVLSRREGLTHWGVTDDFVAFKWDNGAWMRTQLVNDVIPEIIFSLTQDMAPATFEITDEWRKAYALVSGVSKEDIQIFADRITGGTQHSEVQHEAVTAVAEGREYSKWTVAYLNSVIAAADRWSPELYPKPATFEGKSIRGLIVGRT